jgi:hypothetical protein
MRVNVTYSVELEDFPAELRNLTAGANTFLENIGLEFDEIEKLLASKNYEDCQEAFGRIRTRLASADFRLDDCMSLLNGYMQAKLTPTEPPPPAENGAPTEDFGERIKMLRDSMQKLGISSSDEELEKMLAAQSELGEQDEQV